MTIARIIISFRIFVVLLFLNLLSGVPAWAQTAIPSSAAEDVQKDYSAIFFEGRKIGYSINERIEQADRVMTTEEVVISIKRADVPLNIRMTEKSIETTDGRPIGFESVQMFGAIAMTLTGTIDENNQVNVTITTGQTTQQQQFLWPEGAVLHEGLEHVARQKTLTPGVTFDVKTFVPTYLYFSDCHLVVGVTEPVDLLGRVVPLTRIDMTMQLPGGVEMASVLYVDSQFNALKQIQPIGEMTVELIACDKQFALSENDVPDFIDQMILPSPTPLNNLDSISSARYHLVSKNDKPLQIPPDDNQTVESDGHGGLYVTVTPLRAKSGESFPYHGNDVEALEATKPNRYLQSDSQAVQSLARQAIGDATDAAEAARRIERFVNHYIREKTLSIGYASAVEIVQSRQGDCTEHAVLTAALCRAVGLPARVAVGYVYSESFGDQQNIFGGHAWTQTYIGGKWIGLDATRAGGGYTAGHLTLLTGNGNPEDFFALIDLQNQFRIAEITVISSH